MCVDVHCAERKKLQGWQSARAGLLQKASVMVVGAANVMGVLCNYSTYKLAGAGRCILARCLLLFSLTFL